MDDDSERVKHCSGILKQYKSDKSWWCKTEMDDHEYDNWLWFEYDVLSPCQQYLDKMYLVWVWNREANLGFILDIIGPLVPIETNSHIPSTQLNIIVGSPLTSFCLIAGRTWASMNCLLAADWLTSLSCLGIKEWQGGERLVCLKSKCITLSKKEDPHNILILFISSY